MTSKLSKIATAIAFLAFAITGCDNGARITTESQFAASSQKDEAVAPSTGKFEEPQFVISHASGKYEESEFSTYDVHGNRL